MSNVLKVILLGNGGVGKSSLMRRYVSNTFEEKTLHTIGVEFLNKNVEHNHKPFSLQIWDTGGQERFKSLRTPFYRGSDICILVFDLTDRDSFKDLNYWLEEFRKYAQIEPEEEGDFPILLLGNKADLPNRETLTKEVYEWCQENHGIPFLEASAKLNINVDKGFMTMVEGAVEREHNLSRSNTGQYQNTIRLTRGNATGNKSGSTCCLKTSSS